MFGQVSLAVRLNIQLSHITTGVRAKAFPVAQVGVVLLVRVVLSVGIMA